MFYRLFRALARLTLHLFFRRIEVEGQDHVPAAGPVLFVPNHTNSLVDPLILMICLRRRLTLTAKNVLGRNNPLGWLMAGLGVITFHRREDVGKGADMRQNVRSLQRCRAVLTQGGALCIFPEGISHSDPKLRPFRLGPARIALDFVTREGNPGRLMIVPTGLLYTEKDQFRSGVWLRFGMPIDAEHWLAQHTGADAVALTEEIRRRVEALTLNHETRRESLILGWAAQLVATEGIMPAPLGSRERPLSNWFLLVARLQAGYRNLAENQRSAIEELSSRLRRYRSELRRRGVEPHEVYLPMHGGRVVLFLVRELELMLVGAPLALFGAFNHLVPYLIVKRVALYLSTDKDHWASNVVYPSFAVFPFFYLLQLAAAWLLLRPAWALLYTIAVPYTGYYALLYRDRFLSALRRARTFLYLLGHRSIRQQLAGEGRAILAEIHALEQRLEAKQALSASPP